MLIEIRPADGGDDAVRFAAELTETLVRALQRDGLTPRVKLDLDRTQRIAVDAPITAWHWLAGPHRVQRIPKGSAARHTSTATITVLDDAPAPVSPDLSRVRVDRIRGTGPGGQHRNRRETSARVVDLETGDMATRMSGRSQSDNIASALDQLRTVKAERLRREHEARTNRRRQRDLDGPKGFTHNQQRGEVIEHASGRRWRIKDWQRGRIN